MVSRFFYIYYINKEKQKKRYPSVIQCYCGRGVSRGNHDTSPWKNEGQMF